MFLDVSDRSRRSWSRRLQLFGWSAVLLGVCLSVPALAVKQSQPPPLVGALVRGLFPGLAQDLGVAADQKGVVVLAVYEGSPAQAVGLRPGDIILEVTDAKGKPVAVADEAKYHAAVNAVPAQKPVTFKVLRGGEKASMTVQRSPGPLGPLVQPAKNPAPRTFKVVPDGSGDAKSLEGALLRACPGDTILIQGVHGDCLIWRSEITLASVDPAKPATFSGLSISYVPGVHLKGLSVVAPSSAKQTAGAGIALTGAPGAIVEDCRVQGFGKGIEVTFSRGVVLAGNIVYGNGQGIEVAHECEVRVTRNLVIGNQRGANEAGGIRARYSQVEVSQNTVLGNRVPQFHFALHEGLAYSIPGIGVWLEAGTSAQVFNNIVGDNNIGLLVEPGARATIEYNDVYGHLIAPKTWSPKTFFEVQVSGAIANFLSGIQRDRVSPPGLSFDPIRYFYKPFLQFPPSQTNLSVDPLFADPLKGDYRLAADSPLAAKGRGGSHIGALPPVGQDRKVSPEPPAPDQGTGGSASPPATSPGSASKAQGSILHLPADAAERLAQALRRRFSDDPELKERLARATVGVVPFALLDLPGVQLGRDFGESFATALINAGFRLADQRRLDKVLSELQVRDAGQVDAEVARKIKEKSGCDLVLLGSVADRGQSVALNVRVLDAESGAYLAAERCEAPKAANPVSPAPASAGAP